MFFSSKHPVTTIIALLTNRLLFMAQKKENMGFYNIARIVISSTQTEFSQRFLSWIKVKTFKNC